MITKIKDLPKEECFKLFGTKKDTLKSLGVTTVVQNKFETLKEMFENETGMVIGQCTSNKAVITPRVTQFKLGEPYVMTLNYFLRGKKEGMFKPFRKTFEQSFRRYRGQDLTDKRLLVSRTGGIGDLIVIQSTLKAIKEKYPTCKIVFASSHAFLDLFTCFPPGLIDEVTEMPFEKKVMDSCAYHLFFINAVENCIESTKLNFYDIYKRVSHLEYDVNNFKSELHPIPYINENMKQIVLPNTVLFHMNSTTRLRSVNPYKWVEIMKSILDKGYSIGIIDSPDKADQVNEFIVRSSLDTTRIQNFAKISKDISTAISIVDCCKAVISIDSAFGHIAGALNKPAVTLCGPYPAFNICETYENTIGLSAHPGYNACGKYPCFYNAQEHLCPFLVTKPGLYPGCLDSIQTETVISSFEQIINKAN